MKNTKVCPKYGSKDIILVPSAWSSGKEGNCISTLFTNYKIDRYVCCECGYSEEWVEKDKLQDLKEKMKPYQK